MKYLHFYAFMFLFIYIYWKQEKTLTFVADVVVSQIRSLARSS